MGPFPAIPHLAAKLLSVTLSDRVACLLTGWLSSLVFLEILLQLQRRFFPALPKWPCRWFFLAFALGTPNFNVTVDASVYHESISWATLWVLVALFALLCYSETRSLWWVMLCGGAIALALGARVTYALHAVALFVGLFALERQAGRTLKAAAARLALFSGPVLAAGLMMMAYNQARFHSPWEYGLRYLPGSSPGKRAYALNRMPENLRNYLLALPRFSREAPWIRHDGWPPFVHTEQAEAVSSVFFASPFLLLSALQWRLFRRQEPGPAPFRIFTVTVALAALLQFLSLLCFDAARRRYMQDFVPMLAILAFIGAGACWTSSMNRSRWHALAWTVFAVSALLHIHLAFFQPGGLADPNLMKTFVQVSPLLRRAAPGAGLDEIEGVTRNDLGVLYLREGRHVEALRQFEQAAKLIPHSTVIQKNLRLAQALAARR